MTNAYEDGNLQGEPVDTLNYNNTKKLEDCWNLDQILLTQ